MSEHIALEREDTQPLDLQEIFGGELSLPDQEEAPELQRPDSLRPPSTEGKDALFKRAVDNYVWEMSRLRWRARLSTQDELQMSMYLDHLEQLLGQREGKPKEVVAEITGTEQDRSPVLMNTWLALLNRDHIAFLDDKVERGSVTTRLILVR